VNLSLGTKLLKYNIETVFPFLKMSTQERRITHVSQIETLGQSHRVVVDGRPVITTVMLHSTPNHNELIQLAEGLNEAPFNEGEGVEESEGEVGEEEGEGNTRTLVGTRSDVLQISRKRGNPETGMQYDGGRFVDTLTSYEGMFQKILDDSEVQKLAEDLQKTMKEFEIRYNQWDIQKQKIETLTNALKNLLGDELKEEVMNEWMESDLKEIEGKLWNSFHVLLDDVKDEKRMELERIRVQLLDALRMWNMLRNRDLPTLYMTLMHQYQLYMRGARNTSVLQVLNQLTRGINRVTRTKTRRADIAKLDGETGAVKDIMQLYQTLYPGDTPTVETILSLLKKKRTFVSREGVLIGILKNRLTEYLGKIVRVVAGWTWRMVKNIASLPFYLATACCPGVALGFFFMKPITFTVKWYFIKIPEYVISYAAKGIENALAIAINIGMTPYYIFREAQILVHIQQEITKGERSRFRQEGTRIIFVEENTIVAENGRLQMWGKALWTLVGKLDLTKVWKEKSDMRIRVRVVEGKNIPIYAVVGKEALPVRDEEPVSLRGARAFRKQMGQRVGMRMLHAQGNRRRSLYDTPSSPIRQPWTQPNTEQLNTLWWDWKMNRSGVSLSSEAFAVILPSKEVWDRIAGLTAEKLVSEDPGDRDWLRNIYLTWIEQVRIYYEGTSEEYNNVRKELGKRIVNPERLAQYLEEQIKLWQAFQRAFLLVVEKIIEPLQKFTFDTVLSESISEETRVNSIATAVTRAILLLTDPHRHGHLYTDPETGNSIFTEARVLLSHMETLPTVEISAHVRPGIIAVLDTWSHIQTFLGSLGIEEDFISVESVAGTLQNLVTVSLLQHTEESDVVKVLRKDLRDLETLHDGMTRMSWATKTMSSTHFYTIAQFYNALLYAIGHKIRLPWLSQFLHSFSMVEATPLVWNEGGVEKVNRLIQQCAQLRYGKDFQRVITFAARLRHHVYQTLTILEQGDSDTALIYLIGVAYFLAWETGDLGSIPEIEFGNSRSQSVLWDIQRVEHQQSEDREQGIRNILLALCDTFLFGQELPTPERERYERVPRITNEFENALHDPYVALLQHLYNRMKEKQ